MTELELVIIKLENSETSILDSSFKIIFKRRGSTLRQSSTILGIYKGSNPSTLAHQICKLKLSKLGVASPGRWTLVATGGSLPPHQTNGSSKCTEKNGMRGRNSYPEEFSRWLAYKRPLIIIIKFHNPVVTCDWEDGKERWHHESNLQFRIRAGWVRLVSRATNVAPFTIDPSLIQDINGLVLLESVGRTRIRASFGLERWWHGSNFVPSPGIPCQVDILHHTKILLSSHTKEIHLNKLKFLVD